MNTSLLKTKSNCYMGAFDQFRVQQKDGSYKFVKDLPWYKKDKTGWPIETFINKPMKSFFRMLCQNIRKIW